MQALRAAGHNVWSVADEAHSIRDGEVLSQAAALEAVLLTNDKDFGELVFCQGKASAGVPLLRLAGVPPRWKVNLVVQAVSDHGDEMKRAFAVLTATTLRIRKSESSG